MVEQLALLPVGLGTVGLQAPLRLLDPAAAGGGEGNHRLAGEVIALHEGIHGPSGNAPPDGIPDEYGVIVLPVGGFGVLQSHVPQAGVIMFLVDPGTFVVVIQVCGRTLFS